MDASRAALRAARMTTQRFASAADADRHDCAEWAAVPPNVRMVGDIEDLAQARCPLLGLQAIPDVGQDRAAEAGLRKPQ